jgi:YVTN family beta-propeller protein
VYVANENDGTVSVIGTSNTVIDIITVGRPFYDPWGTAGSGPLAVAVSPAGANAGDVYVANYYDGTISVINPAGNVINVIPAGSGPNGSGPVSLAVAPAGTGNAGTVYVADEGGAVTVINPAGTVTDVITVGLGPTPSAVAVCPSGVNAGDVYVTTRGNNEFPGAVSVISPGGTVIETITVGGDPYGLAFGDGLYGIGGIGGPPST